MNNVNLIGRLTKDPQVSYTGQQMAVAKFSIAIDRGKDKGADFPNIVAFGKTAELAEKWLKKGQMVGVSGHIQTGSYEKDGRKVYTTDVVADRVTIIEWPEKQEQEVQQEVQEEFIPDDSIPF